MTLVTYRPTYAQIDLSAIRQNVATIKRHVGEDVKVIAVVKANAYGHGVIDVSKAAIEGGATVLAVATPDEALEIRNAAIANDILVLGYSPPAFAEIAAQKNIHCTVFQKEWFEQLPPLSVPVNIHIKVDTGMARLGIRTIEEANELLAEIKKHPNIHLTGMYTHFATADEENNDYYNKQMSGFEEFLEIFPKNICIHASNSAGALMKQEAKFNAVRVGIAMYGLSASPFVSSSTNVELKPVMSVHTEIVHMKKIEAGESVSYGASYTAKQDEWVAVIPIGYADGMLRALAGQEVLIDGKRMPIIGKICMDQCMVRVDKKYPIGEPVVLIGNQGNEGIRVEEWSNKLNTISYEIPCILTNRVPRVVK